MEKSKGLEDSIEQRAICCHDNYEQSMDRASFTTSIDGFSSHETLEDGDLSSSPIDLICGQTPRDASSSDDEASPLGWPLARQQRSRLRLSPASRMNTPGEGFLLGVAPSSPTSAESSNLWDDKREKRETTSMSEVELMKERFSKLLLGEDMSGSGKGVCTALAISNAITNLAASVFGELWRLEPLSPERKAMWHREMEWLLSVGDYIVEFVPSFQSISDGSSLEVMISRPRSDLHINLPALHKLDAMLLEILDSFKETDFWYVEQGVSVGAQNNHKAAMKRQEDKWWLPVPKIPTGGLSDKSRKALQYQRDCTSQILKAALAINEQVLSEMQVPEVYWDSLPKSAKTSLGETLYHGLESEQFSPDALLSSLDLSTEHKALNIANRVQSAIHVWRRKVPSNRDSSKDGKGSSSRYPWVKVRDMVADCGKRLGLIERADSLLLSLRQRFPGLPQTVLDVNKIQFNKDVGQAILESYSRVLESLAFSILSRIEDVLYIADMTKRNQAGVSQGSTRKMPAPFPNRISTSTPYITPFASPGSSPSLSPSPRRPTNSPSADQGGGGSASACPLLGSLCSVETSNVKDVKRPAAKERSQPWSDIEYRKSFYSPPDRD